MNWYLKVLKQYADFNGRARRTEYWMFVLFNLIFSLVASFLDSIFGSYVIVAILYALVLLVPSLAVTVRRLHDTGKSGWMILVSLIPVVGAIWLIILLLTEGVAGNNQYGNNPKETVLIT
ncbi:MAG: DUF805 domain-containing protein [Bacteroidales bacterium]|nr:DUF805 domain-containing protein [Bacteroidales bacterium]